MNRRTLAYAAALAFVAAIVLANYLTTRYGMVGVGLALTATAGTYAAGLALGLRDAVQEGLGRAGVFAVIAAGAVVSYAVADGRIATASAVALVVSELADWSVYSPLRGRWPLAVLASNIVGAVVDTVLFLAVAGFPLTAQGIGGQLVGKIVWATLVPLGLLYAARSLRTPAAA